MKLGTIIQGVLRMHQKKFESPMCMQHVLMCMHEFIFDNSSLTKQNQGMVKKIRVAHGCPICMLNDFGTSACNVHAYAMCMQHVLKCMHKSIFGNSS